MLKRIITSIVAIAVFLPFLWFSDTWLFPIGLAVVSLISLFEMFRCIGIHKKFAITVPVYAAGLVLPFLIRAIDDGTFLVAVCAIAGIAYLIYSFALVIWSHGKFTYGDMCVAALTSFYILLAINLIMYIRDFVANGKFIYLLIFIGAWVTDIFAYFTGVFIGKHKLIEDVSPKKTVEGSVGGIFFCVASFVAFGFIADKFFQCNANLVFLALSGIFISVIAQIGDLIMSVIKRHYGIKDYGKMFPGHGGMLDRFDSILAVSLGVAAMCMVSYVTNIPFM